MCWFFKEKKPILGWFLETLKPTLGCLCKVMYIPKVGVDFAKS